MAPFEVYAHRLQLMVRLAECVAALIAIAVLVVHFSLITSALEAMRGADVFGRYFMVVWLAGFAASTTAITFLTFSAVRMLRWRGPAVRITAEGLSIAGLTPEVISWSEVDAIDPAFPHPVVYFVWGPLLRMWPWPLRVPPFVRPRLVTGPIWKEFFLPPLWSGPYLRFNVSADFHQHLERHSLLRFARIRRFFSPKRVHIDCGALNMSIDALGAALRAAKTAYEHRRNPRVNPMNLQSLALRTDLIFNRFAGQVRDLGDCIAISTPHRPDWLWGNYLIMRDAPDAGAIARWTGRYNAVFGADRPFRVLTWDDPSGVLGDVSSFREAGFMLHTHTTLAATAVTRPVFHTSAFTVRPLASESDWDQYLDVHVFEDSTYGTAEEMRCFTKVQRDQLRAMVDAGLGLRFGAFQGERLISELGIYWDGEVARFNNVGTRADARRQGAARALVYHASRYVLENTPCKMLVIEAVADSAAARLYQDVGFKPVQQLRKLEWLRPKPSPRA